jgi:hypothetical protein
MGLHSNKFTTTTADIIHTATTIDIMRIEYTDMAIGIIIEKSRDYMGPVQHALCRLDLVSSAAH